MTGSLLIENVTVVTMDDDRRIVTDATIVVRDGRIIELSQRGRDDGGTLPTSVAADATRIDATGMVAIPGLIDTHAHADQSILRGAADDLHWISFLAGLVEPNLRLRTASEAVTAYELSMYEMLSGGTTCFVSPNVSPEDDFAALGDAINAFGIRAVLGCWTQPVKGTTDGSRESLKAVDRIASLVDHLTQTPGGLVTGWFGLMVPREPGDGTFPAFYKAAAHAAAELDAGVVFHFSSEAEDLEFYRRSYGIRPAIWAERQGLLGPSTLLINCGLMSRKELRVVGRAGAHIVHSPSATMKMSSGLLSHPQAKVAGVNISLGTDGPANNNSFNMLAEAKTACLLQNALAGKPGTVTAEEALEMATINGARAIGRAADLGSLEVGKLADIVLIDMRRPHIQPVHDVVSALVYAARPSDVATVVVDGVVRALNGTVVGGPPLDALMDRANEVARTALERLRYPRDSRWPTS